VILAEQDTTKKLMTGKENVSLVLKDWLLKKKGKEKNEI